MPDYRSLGKKENEKMSGKEKKPESFIAVVVLNSLFLGGAVLKFLVDFINGMMEPSDEMAFRSMGYAMGSYMPLIILGIILLISLLSRSFGVVVVVSVIETLLSLGRPFLFIISFPILIIILASQQCRQFLQRKTIQEPQ